MSDHAWVLEHVAAYLAGGLDAQEAERLETHARACPECAAAIDEARHVDDCLSNLFVHAHPVPAMEDRAVNRVRTEPPPGPQGLNPRVRRLVSAVAAVLLLGVIGSVAGALVTGEGLGSARKEDSFSFVGSSIKPPSSPEPRLNHRNDGRVPARAKQVLETSAELTPEDKPVPPGVDRVDKSTVDAVVSQDNIGVPNSPNTDTTALAAPGVYATDLTRGKMLGYDIAPAFDPTATPNRKAPVFDPTSLRPSVPNDPPPKPADPKDPTPAPKPAPADPKAPDPNPEPVRRIIIRSGDMEFEVESFDGATATITKLVLGIKGAFVATVNSDKLPNGKVKGAITVRVPPEQLDGLVLDLRRELAKGGELKGVKLTSQDITKMYTDIESRLRGARTMETRLLQIIKEGKGEIKQLLEAEKELGIWRTKIEEYEGEIRYYSNLAAFSTLTITLTEKEIRAAATITERERVQAGVEVNDVDKAYQQLLTAIVEAKGRITKSEMKQLTAGQFNAAFVFEVAADASGPLRDRLKMLGRLARLEIDRAAQPEGGTLPSDAKTKRGDTIFLVQLYNLANVPARETATLHVATPDVPAAYQALRDAVAKTTGRVLVAQLNEQDKQNISAQFEFEVKRSDEGAVRTALDTAGEAISRHVTRAAESDSVTDSKVQYKVTLVSASRLKPRETSTLSVEVADVDKTASNFAAQVTAAKGRQVDAKFDRDAGGRATAKLVFEVPLAEVASVVDQFKGAGTVRVSQSVRDPQATEGKFATARIHVTLTNVEAIVPEGDGLWSKVRKGLSISASVLLTSVTWVVFGLCVVLPWAVVGFGGYRLVRRFGLPITTTSTSAAPTPPTTPPASV